MLDTEPLEIELAVWNMSTMLAESSRATKNSLEALFLGSILEPKVFGAGKVVIVRLKQPLEKLTRYRYSSVATL